MKLQFLLDEHSHRMLAGQGACAFARACDATLISPSDQISPRAKADWEAWTRKLRDAESSSSYTSLNDNSVPNYGDRQDTVGSVSCDMYGNMAAGVSR